MAVLSPWRTGDVVPTVDLLASGNGVAALLLQGAGDAQTVYLVTDDSYVAQLDLSAYNLSVVSTDASFAAIRFEDGQVVSVVQEGASFLTVGGQSEL